MKTNVSKTKKRKNTKERHRRKKIDFGFAHIKVVALIAALAIATLIGSWILNTLNIAFWSSILANIFAGLITGLVICLIAGTKQISITKLESQKTFLVDLCGRIKEYQMLFDELIKRPFSKYDDSEELFDFIYDVGSHANWVNDFVLQGTFDEKLSLDPQEYCKALGYDAYALIDEFEELHDNLRSIDINYPTKKEILGYFEKVDKPLRRLGNAAYHKQKDIEANLERLNYLLF